METNVTYEVLEERATRHYALKTKGRVYGIDPAVIAMILDIVMKLIQGCFAKGNDGKVVKSFADNHPVLARLMVRRQMRNSELNRSDAPAVVEAILAMGQEATAEEIDAAAALELPMDGGT